MTAMQIRSAGRWLGFALLVASLVHVGTVWLLPHMTMGRVLDQSGGIEGYNRMIHLPAGAGETGPLVRRDPDALYSICPFDLSAGPLAVEAPAGGLRSITILTRDTQPIPLPDAAGGQMPWRAVIALDSAEGAIASPSSKGVIVIRRVSPGDSNDAAAGQAGDACGTATGG